MHARSCTASSGTAARCGSPGRCAEGDEVAGFEVVELAGPRAGADRAVAGVRPRRARLATPSTSSTCSGRHAPAHVPHVAYNLDTEQARGSIRKLAALDPLVVGVGHLGPMRGPGVRAELEAAAASLSA